MRILIIQTAFIGDVVLATPLIEKLKDQYPDSQIDFLLRKGNENLLVHHPKLNNVLIWDKKKDKIKNLMKMVKTIRKSRYDVLINLQRFASSGIMSWLSGARQKVGFAKNPFSFSYHVKIAHKIGNGTHEVARNLQLIRHLVDDETMVRPRLYPPAEASEKVAHFKTRRYIVIAPTSVWFTKQFPEQKWVAFLQQLSFEGNIYLIGAPSDAQAAKRIIDQAGKGENLCGKLSLIESVALIENATMTYVNDSAPMHFASAVNAPTCAVFCSTIPDFGFGPLSDNAHVMEIAHALTCRPCGLHGKKECPEGHFKCGMDIDVSSMSRLLKN